MERCKTLIRKLQEQLAENADPAAMMVTVQLLEAELALLIDEKPDIQEISTVSVVLPGFSKRRGLSEDQLSALVKESREPPKEEDRKDEGVFAEKIILPSDNSGTPREVWLVDPVLETPTLAHQDEIKELNEMMSRLSGESLNDRLKVARDDISSFLTDTPVRDLKKAIGINDRFVFVNELFRGDVDMYERSIKTINNFRILAEAEYWIERELKIKLGWDDSSETGRQFYKLIKRRFS